MHFSGARRRVVPLSTTHAVLLRMHHVTAPIYTGWNSSSTSNGFVDDVPPSPRSVVESVCRLFHSGSDVRRKSCFWRKSTDNVSIVVIVFLLEGKLSLGRRGKKEDVDLHRTDK